MLDYQAGFIKFALAKGALKFGSFELKSGRVSPYFFNTGVFNRGADLSRLGEYYSAAILRAGIAFDMLYGPAYKGIPLATAIGITLWSRNGRDVPVCFNRKETKDHGEGGDTLGAPLQGQVLIVDDVISAGTAVNESVSLIKKKGARPIAVAITLDRQERGRGELSAVEEVEQKHGLAVINVITLADIVAYLHEDPQNREQIDAIERYHARYGCSSEE